MSAPAGVMKPKITDWRERLALTTATMRAMSQQTDPQEMRRIYVEPDAPAAAVGRLRVAEPSRPQGALGARHAKHALDGGRSIPGKNRIACRCCPAGCWPS